MEQEVAEMEDGKQTAVGNGGVRLSGGQAKRLALARTLCHKKPVLILDDPFSALDKNTEKQIFANLKQQTKDNIVFLISHRLYLFPQMNQVIWMEGGKAVAGTHEEILERYRSTAVCMRHRAMKERMRKWKRKIEKQFLNIQRKGGVADETEKTGKKCDPGNNQKTENAVCRNPDRSDRSSCGSADSAADPCKNH